MAEQDALGDAKFGGGLFLSDFPAKIRVLTVDPMVYNDNFGNTKYAFIVFNIEDNKVQILDKTAGFPKRFQEIHLDSDYGNDVRGIDLKITTNGAQGKEIRYTINPLGEPKALTQEQLKVIKEAAINLEDVIKKKNPGALRLSEINGGKKLGPALNDQPIEPSKKADDDITIEDIGDEPIDLDDIPF